MTGADMFLYSSAALVVIVIVLFIVLITVRQHKRHGMVFRGGIWGRHQP